MSTLNAEPSKEIHAYSLQRYLHTSWLPSFRAAHAPSLDELGRATAWPEYSDLRRLPGTRRLGLIDRIDWVALSKETSSYFDQLRHVYIECQSSEESPLMLPNGDLTEMETRDYQYLANIDSESKFTQLVEIYVLDTVSEALRIIHDVSTSAPQANALKFTETPQFSSIWKSKWDVFYLPGKAIGTFSVAIICIPPWAFGFKDFDDFVAEQMIPSDRGDLDTLSTAPFNQPCYKLWAALYDTCVGRGYHFVVTTYDRWAFGRFNADWSAVQITEKIQSPIHEFDGSTLYSQWEGPNIMEVLVYWIQTARCATGTSVLTR